ncbi:MAG TPA: 16S rRNA (cytosine(1402)-N(4))-methyltransferase RsmH, partial [Stellaceae bacterium]|nr:16S rRNA (cytosine(1402)-N(4))-methyltransferase RsmH [Stellaceae bacterium]
MMVRRGPPGAKPTEPETARHIPVLLSEVVESLKPSDGEIFIDGTFGAGGYTRALLEAANCRVIGIDRDPSAIAGAQKLAAEFPGRLTIRAGPFSRLDAIAEEQGAPWVDGVVLDIGVSSMQLDDPARGFSFQADGPLDMRMSLQGPTAADIVNTMDEEKLARILYVLGEERRSRAIARAITKARADS